MSYRREIRDDARRPVGWTQHEGLGAAAAANEAGISAYGQGTARQGDVYGMLSDRAQGRGGPSMAQMQLAQGSQQNVVNQMGMAAQGRGGGLAAQARQVQGMGAAAQMGLNQQTSQLQLAEQQQAEAMMAQQANTMAGQDLTQMLAAQQGLQSVYGQQYGGNLQTNLANQQNRMQMYQMDLERRKNNRAFATGLIDSGAGMVEAAGSVMPLL
jgi:hypothetical protein